MGNEVNVRGNQLKCYFSGDREIKNTYALSKLDYLDNRINKLMGAVD